MLRDQDIVCVSLPTWDGRYMKAVVHVMRQLARTNNVLFVDYPFTAKDMAMTWAGRQDAPVRRMLGVEPRLRRVPVGTDRWVHVLSPPPVLPINGLPDGPVYDGLLRVNGAIVGHAIRQAMRSLDMSSPIVINAFNPFVGLPLAGALNESLLVYYCYDEIKAAPWNSRHGARLEQAFLKKADVVITTSEGLHLSRKASHPHCYLVKNGVDFDLFHQAYTPHPSIDEAPQRRTCIGYLGSLDDRLDYDLIEALCSSAPDLDFHFVGRIVTPGVQERLGRYPNVHLLGARPPAALPGLLRQMDLGIIPFARTPFTRNIYPLKINEYLAAGKPVVMTDFAPLDEFSALVRIARTPDAFLTALRQELAFDTVDREQARIAMARSNAWADRVERIGSLLSYHLQGAAA